MRLVGFAWKNLFRRPIRTGLTVIGVSVAVGAVVALVGIAGSFERALLDLFQRRGVDLIVARKGGVQQMNSVVDEKLGAEIGRVPGVREISPGLLQPFSFPELDVFGAVARGMPADSFLLKGLKTTSGRLLRKDDKRVIVMGAGLAASLRKSVGDTLEVVPGRTFKVVGIYESENLLENGSFIMPLAELQDMMDLQGRVTAFNLVVDHRDADAIEEIKQRIKAIAPYLQAQTLRENVDSAVEIRLAKAVAWLTSAVAFVLGTIGMINTMLTAVFERTRELSVLRAVGWRKRRVMELVLWESVLLGVAGAVLGTVLAIVLTQVLSTIPASGRMVAGEISLPVVLQGFLLALIVGVAGGLYPAYRAAHLMPTQGLRHE